MLSTILARTLPQFLEQGKWGPGRRALEQRERGGGVSETQKNMYKKQHNPK